MQRSTVTRGLVIAVVAAFSFGSSGALLKPMFDAGWSPVAVVAARSLIGGFALLPFALVAVRGHWPTVWRSRWRILALSVTGVSGTLLFYFLSIERIPVATGILIEYLAPLLLVGVVWVTTRRMPHAVVLIGSAVALKNSVRTARLASGLCVRIRDTSALRSDSETGSPARIFLRVGFVSKCFLSSASTTC